jgi:hypothetical protein
MCLKKKSRLKPKELKIGDKKNVYKIRLLKLSNNYKIVGLINDLLISMKSHCKIIRFDYLIILPQLN